MVDSDRHPRIACIGGGTGLFTLLSGLKEQWPQADLRAIVAMTDSGGSTGKLREEFGYLPPGDVRKCLVALSNAPELLTRMMEHRFLGGDGFKGHSLGNLFLTACKEMTEGDEYEAIRMMGTMLDIHGSVYPITTDNCHLVAHLADGTTVFGETNIDIPRGIRAPIERVSLSPPASAFLPTAEALRTADVIIIGPGDLFTSILPNLIVDGAAEAIRDAQAAGANIVYIVNTMTKYGETNGYTAKKFVEKVQDALGDARIDTVFVNNGMISDKQREAYELENAQPVRDDLSGSEIPYRVVLDDLVRHESFARHDAQRLASALRRELESRVSSTTL